MPAGQPAYYKTPEEFEAACDSYFAKCAADETPLTITGLVLYLGFCERKSLYDYEAKPEFLHVVKKARMRVENGYELRLSGNSPTGSIFALKNMGWKDKTEQEMYGKDGGPIAIGWEV